MRPIPPEPATAALLALLATGCTVEHQPAAVAGTAGAKPGIVVGGMTSAVEYRPLTVEELAIPGTRSAVEQCERAGRQHCREQEVPRDRRRTFTKGVDPKAVALFQVGGLRPGMTLDGACRFTDPSGSTAATLHATSAPWITPPDLPPQATLDFSCTMGLSSAVPAGDWTVECVINGERALVLRFEVVEASNSGAV